MCEALKTETRGKTKQRLSGKAENEQETVDSGLEAKAMPERRQVHKTGTRRDMSPRHREVTKEREETEHGAAGKKLAKTRGPQNAAGSQ